MRKGVIFANDKSDRLFMDDTPIQRAECRVVMTQVAAQAKLAVPLQDIVHDDRGIFVLDAETVGGVHLAELCDLLRQELGIVGKKRRDKDDIPLHISTMLHSFHAIVDLIHCTLDVLVKDRTAGRQRDISALLLEQRHAQLDLQVVDRLGQSRLGNEKGTGGLCVVLQLCNGLEIDQGLKIHRISSHRSFCFRLAHI